MLIIWSLWNSLFNISSRIWMFNLCLYTCLVSGVLLQPSHMICLVGGLIASRLNRIIMSCVFTRALPHKSSDPNVFVTRHPVKLIHVSKLKAALQRIHKVKQFAKRTTIPMVRVFINVLHWFFLNVLASLDFKLSVGNWYFSDFF